MFTTDLTTPFTTAELQAMRDLLQNETAWDRDADTGGFNAYHSADNPERVLVKMAGGIEQATRRPIETAGQLGGAIR